MARQSRVMLGEHRRSAMGFGRVTRYQGGSTMMAKDSGALEASPAETEPSLAASALRMRRHRERRRRGMLCFRIELTENVINELIRRKRLTADYRENPNAVGQTLQQYLEYTMW